MVDIRRKTTYLYRNTEGRQVRGLTSFLQVNRKNSANIDPENGMNFVGPMLRLTACAELKPDEDDFDAVYPDSSLSFGPTVCSIGLKYNDHNYAIPSGLTPPAMAPHLMEVSMPKMKFSHGVRKTLHRSADGLSPSGSDHESSDAAKRIEDALHSGEFTYKTPTANSVNADFNTWASKTDISEHSGRDPFTGSRFMRGAGVCERLEMRSEPEMKVIEVPEEMAVSPSQLSDLDSDSSELETSSKVQYQITVVDGNLMQGSVLPNIRCICNTVQYKAQLISCPYCGFYQHVGCMGNFYGISLPQLSEGYVCSFCRDTSSCHRFGIETQSHAQFTDTHNQDQIIQDVYNKMARDNPEEASPIISSTAGVTQFTESQVASDALSVDPLKRVDQTSLLSPCVNSRLSDKARGSGFKENEGITRQTYTSSEWDHLSELSRSQKRTINDTNVNLRMPSPPRASKRKQDLTSTSYNESDVASATVVAAAGGTTTVMAGNHPVGTPIGNCSNADEFSCPSSATQTPVNTPLSTPQKLLMQPLTPRTPLSTPGTYPLTPRSEYSSSSGLDSSPNSSLRIDEKRRHKRLTPSKLQLGVRANPFGSAWLKDYKEASNNEYSKAVVEYINNRIGTNVERNHRIPPSCLTRSSLCRVVYFDHNEMGLEAYIRLGANEVVTEVRGKFLLMEEYEHFVDPTSDYRRYVMFYHSFGDRVVVIDASQYGNNARFIRRSCIPNCHLKHYVVQGNLQVVIRTSTEVMPGAELTLPFDMDFRACHYQLNCACARSRCPVVKWGRKLVRNKVVPRLDYQKFIESQLRILSETRQEGSSSRSANYESSTLSGSPIVRTPIGASTSSPSSQPSTGQNAGLTFLLSPPGISSLQASVRKDSEELVNSKRLDSDQCVGEPYAEPKADQHADVVSSLCPNDDQLDIDTCSNTVLPSVSSAVKKSETVEATDQTKPRFEPVITTRRQAAVMRSAVR